MSLDLIPIWAFALIILLLVFITIEIGFRLGVRYRLKMTPGMESPIGIILGAVLGLLGFILAFTFGIVYNRFELRKDLVRQEANAIGRIWMRSDFMSEPDRGKTQDLLNKYIELRVTISEISDMNVVNAKVGESARIQRALWNLAVVSAHKDGISGLVAPFTQSLNDLIDIHLRRLAIGVEDRIPLLIWLALFILLALSMGSVGYLTGVKSDKRSIMTIALALSFTIIFLLISALDRPFIHLFPVSQRPLLDVKATMSKQF
ncbi:MAG: hypothetical protein ACHQEM_10185 [Chitinophagales bacterium]